MICERDAYSLRMLKCASAWLDRPGARDAIQYDREHLAHSFGSCSFEEPVDHLRDLEWL